MKSVCALRSNSPEHYRELLKNAPLWLDWQIQQIVANRDLKQASQSQQVADGMVKLLKKISDGNQRNHYIRHCAELLSLGDARMVSMWADNLLTQIAPVNSYRQSILTKKRQQDKTQSLPVAGDRTLLEQAEAILLRIYLHCPEHRQAVSDALLERDLQFSLSHHRFLWQQILDLMAENNIFQVSHSVAATQTQVDLISSLQVRCLEFEIEMAQVSYLFHLDEKTQHEHLLRATQVIQAATACIERVMCEKRCRQYLKKWEEIDSSKEPEDQKLYHDLFCQEQQRLQELDRQRQFSLTDLI